ncbi:BZ3500_MvSof-1268-A1-R1_Chr6-1g08362 [Microbotryum saponariae]|uniref:BZ3500_MvSof-1268-A1-R1_Chr6-1g08362 protein n=1 Tax=Microbotryum saponariae TaxID=289078 RepID=A0A2X0KPN4_9BASI|nr:BZ3500_MvSof-1268-A1-R1_Chr6-1g08362 [Microbotryum saponariae]SDA07646.1 BZ3501_MvSof-1269-A2-R1_Chr6-1g08083 [Microbotryum saponariae]
MSRTIRSASISRKTNETDIAITLTLDVAVGAAQEINISTGIGFLDHVSLPCSVPAYYRFCTLTSIPPCLVSRPSCINSHRDCDLLRVP